MLKAVQSKSDPYLALLAWRNTPNECLGSSSAQRLFNRRTRTLLPTASNLLEPQIPSHTQTKLKKQKEIQGRYFNRGAHSLDELKAGDVVRIQPLSSTSKNKEWTKAKVTAKVGVRSYEVITENGTHLRRDRRHLKRTNESFDIDEEELIPPVPEDTNPTHLPLAAKPVTPAASPHVADQPHSPLDPQGPNQMRTRGGRSIRLPEHLRDYVIE